MLRSLVGSEMCIRDSTKLEAVLDTLTAEHNDPFIVSVHSFTDRLMGAPDIRPWELAVLWRHDEPTARKFIAEAAALTGWTIGDNEPYSAFELNYTVDRHLAPRGLRHLTLEIRQDLIGDDNGILRVGAQLAEVIRRIA